MTQLMLDGHEPHESDVVRAMPMPDRVARAVGLLQDMEPPEGYYEAFSGGKDSVTIDKLAQMAGVKREKTYNNTTIDPPELVRFIKREHPDAKWNQPKHGNMLHRVAVAPKTPPTRRGRWCCEEYKEYGGDGRVKIFGVRAEESTGRENNWREVAQDLNGDQVICPIVFWTKEQVWEFIRAYAVPYCELYDQGWERLGCIGCPLASKKNQDREFARWPRYEQAWKRAIVANWEKWREIPNTRTGKPRHHAKFSSGEAYWQWWRNYRAPDLLRECQSGKLWTNSEEAV